MRQLRTCVLATLFAVACSPPPTPELERVQFPATVGPEGAIVFGAPDTELDGLELTIPPGALSEPTEVSARLLAEEPLLGPTGIVVGPTFLLSPEGKALNATLTLPFYPSRVDDLEQTAADCRAWLRDGTTWAQTPQSASSPGHVSVAVTKLGAAAAGAVLKTPNNTLPAGPPCTEKDGWCITALSEGLKETSAQYSAISSTGKLYALRSRTTPAGIAYALTEYDVTTGLNTATSDELEVKTSAVARPLLSEASQRLVLASDGTAFAALPSGVAQLSLTARPTFVSEAQADTRTAGVVITPDGRRHRVRLTANKTGTVKPQLTLVTNEGAPAALEESTGPWSFDQLPVAALADNRIAYGFQLGAKKPTAVTPPKTLEALVLPGGADPATFGIDELAVSADGQRLALSLQRADPQGRTLFVQSKDGTVSRGISGLGNLLALEFGDDGALWAATGKEALVYRIEPRTGAITKVLLTDAAFGTAEYKSRIPVALRAFSFGARHVLFVVTQGLTRGVVRVEASTATGTSDGGTDAGTDAGVSDGGVASDGGAADGGAADGGAGFCGDGVVQSPREECDGPVSAAAVCGDAGYVQGTAGCSASCTLTGAVSCFQNRARAAAVADGIVCAIGARDGLVRCAGATAPVAVLDGGSMSAVAVGGGNGTQTAVCALRASDGTVVCAGPGAAAQPTTSASYSELALTKAGNTACAIRTGGGAVDCWGAAFTGTLPAGSRNLTASGDRLCALTAANDVTCISQSNPAQSFTGPFISAAAGTGFVTAVRPDGGVVLLSGSGTNTLDRVPLQGPYSRVLAGDAHACAERASGGVDCWGLPTSSRGQVQQVRGALAASGETNTCQLESGVLACFGGDFSFDPVPFGPGAAASSSLLRGDLALCARPVSGGPPVCRGELYTFSTLAPGSAVTTLASGFDEAFHQYWCALDAQRMLHCTENGAQTPPRGPYRFVDRGLRFAVDDSGTFVFLNRPIAALTSPPPDPLSSAAIGVTHACGLRASDGTAVCWGTGFAGETTPPAGSFVELALSSGRTCGLSAAGVISCTGQSPSSAPSGTFRSIWFESSTLCGLTTAGARVCRASGAAADVTEPGPFRQARDTCRVFSSGALSCPDAGARSPQSPSFFHETPAGDFAQVLTAPPGQGMGLLSDGGVVFWGSWAQPTVQVKSGSSSVSYACTVMSDDSLRCWGVPFNHTVGPPDGGSFRQVEVSTSTVCALGTDNRVRCFGDATSPVVAQAPSTEQFQRVALGINFACGLRLDGTLRCWGDNTFGFASPPAGTFTDLAMTNFRGCALNAAGAMTCWGLVAAALPAGTYRGLRGGPLAVGLCGLLADGGAVCEPLARPQLEGPVVDVAVSGSAICALRPDGGVDCVRGRADLFGL